MQRFRRPGRSLSVLLFGGALVAAACSAGAEVSVLQEAAPPPYRVEIVVVDEAGDRIEDAAVIIDGESGAAAGGSLVVERIDPVLAIVDAEGYLAEPLVISRDLASRHEVRLFSRQAASGAERVAFHFGGDTMMGRRYVNPTREGTPVLAYDVDAAARSVVRDVAPLMRSADMTTVNLETVVGELDASTAYPGKRFLLQTPPEALGALEEMGVDLVTLGNNHAYDWLEQGVAETLSALDAIGMPHPGAGRDSNEARSPGLLDVRGRRVATLSYTTVTGDFVNDHLPVSGEEPPAALPPGEAWQYEPRPFSYGAPGDEVYLAADRYRAGDVWRWFDALVPDLRDAEEAPVWTALTARDAFPELQDWVARRGHGGAARFLTGSVERDVADARAGGADFVIVQLHGGFQFSEVASSFFATAARASVDAGADLVIGHHPHVVQGFEWYDGRLIAYSLGNFIFDQDFLSTFPAFVLRTVYEGDRLLEARVFPTMLDGYRPVAVAGEAAARILTHLDAGSVPATRARRLDGQVRRVVDPELPALAAHAAIEIDGNAGLVGHDRVVRERFVSQDKDGVASLPVEDLVLVGGELDGIEFGHDLLEWGAFDDWAADGGYRGGMHWELDSGGAVRLVDLPGGADVAVELTATRASGALVRPVARVTRLEHTIFDSDGSPIDGDAEYSIRLRVRRSGDAASYVRVDVYHFDDTNPVRDPVSSLVRQIELPLDVASDANWHRLSVDLPDALFSPDESGRPVTAALLYVGLERGEGNLVIDRVEFLEWRDASTLPVGSWAEVDGLRGVPLANGVTLTVS